MLSRDFLRQSDDTDSDSQSVSQNAIKLTQKATPKPQKNTPVLGVLPPEPIVATWLFRLLLRLGCGLIQFGLR